MSKDDVAEQLRRHALITALAAQGGPAGAIAIRLGIANACGSEAAYREALEHVPGYVEKPPLPPLAVS